MAHPLTQQPPSSIPFGSASRPSPLAFGFGQPSHTNAFAAGQSFSGGNLNKAATTFGFGASSPSKKSFSTPRPTLPHLAGPSSSLKRSRRSSTSSESASPPHSPSHPYSRPKLYGRDKDHGDLLSDVKAVSRDGGVDLGVLLGLFTAFLGQKAKPADTWYLKATLPSTAHLSILLQVLQNNPHLTSSVLAQIPQPEMGECLQTLSKHMDKICKASHGTAGDGPETQAGRRLWMRIENDVSQYCISVSLRIANREDEFSPKSQASTYLHYFTTSTSTDHNRINIQPLLFAITSAIYKILSLVPTSTNNPNALTSTESTNINHPASAKPVLDLANVSLSKWGQWIETLSREVNQLGGMYPHSSVTTWIEGLDELANPSTTISTNNNNMASLNNSETISRWRTTSHSHVQDTTQNHPLVMFFREAFGPVRDKFLSELGWLVGRQPSHLTPTLDFGESTQSNLGWSPSPQGGMWPGNPVLAGGRGEDEEL